MATTSNTLDLEDDLKKAIKQKEFRLYYQPKIDLVSGEIAGVEALIRWEHPEKGLISPMEFIPLAEENGLIVPIGEWVLWTACMQNKVWHDAGYLPLRMSINVSAHQLYQPGFVEIVKDIIKKTEIPPEYLILEITERIMPDFNISLKVIKELKSIGIQMSLDDFGIGFNSLYHLQELPIDEIKIDRSFVNICTTDLKSSVIVKSTIEMARQLNIGVIAEGIETKDQLIFLREHHCSHGQGYFFSKPLPVTELEQHFHKIEQVAIGI